MEEAIKILVEETMRNEATNIYTMTIQSRQLFRIAKNDCLSDDEVVCNDNDVHDQNLIHFHIKNGSRCLQKSWKKHFKYLLKRMLNEK